MPGLFGLGYETPATPSSGPMTDMYRSYLQNNDAMQQRDAGQAMMAEAVRRLSGMGTPRAQAMAQLIQQNPRAAQMEVEDAGGWSKYVQQLEAESAARQAAALGPGVAGQDAALGTGTAAGIDTASDLARIDALRGQRGYYDDRGAAALQKARNGKPLTIDQQQENANILRARAQLDRFIKRYGWNESDLQAIAASQEPTWGTAQFDDEEEFAKAYARRLVLNAQKALNGDDPDFERYGGLTDPIPPQAPDNNLAGWQPGQVYRVEDPENPGKTIRVRRNPRTGRVEVVE